MTLSLVVTPGAANANSYASLADASAYFASNVAFSPLWTALAEQVKIARLIEAGKGIDRYTFRGSREFGTQSMLFPRIECNADDDGTVPTPVKNAQLEMLLVQYANANTTTGASNALADAVDEIGLGRGALNVKLAPSRVSISEAIALGGSLATVETLLAPYRGGGGRNSFEVSR